MARRQLQRILTTFALINFLLQLEKVPRLPRLLRVFLRVLELEEILRVMRETLFHSRLSCVMLAPLVLEAMLWAAPKRNLNRRGAEERDACYA